MKFTTRVHHYRKEGMSVEAARILAKHDCENAAQRNMVSVEASVFVFRNALHCMHLYGAPGWIKEHANKIALALPGVAVQHVTVLYCDATRDYITRTPPCFTVWADIAYLNETLNLSHGSEVRQPIKTKVAQGSTLRVTGMVNDWRDTERWVKRTLYMATIVEGV